MRPAPALLALGLVAAGCNAPEGDSAPGSAAPANTATAAPTPSMTASAAPAPSATAAPDPCASVTCSSLERCEAGACKPACPKGEVFIPPTGPKGFTMGAALHGDIDPPHTVILTKPFCMDATEVTVGAYKKCVEAKKCEVPRLWGMWRNYPKLEDHPVNKIDWKQSRTYCQWRGQDLPTEAQWEWATTGGDGRKWAWGNDKPTCKHADYAPGQLRTPSSDDGCHGGGTSPVGAHPLGDRTWPDGKIHDLSGNVWEWVLDNYVKYKKGSTETDPLHMKAIDGVHVARGGGWNRSDRGIRAHYRAGSVVTYKVPGLGFRCVRNVDAAKSSPEKVSPAAAPPASASAPSPPGRP